MNRVCPACSGDPGRIHGHARHADVLWGIRGPGVRCERAPAGGMHSGPRVHPSYSFRCRTKGKLSWTPYWVTGDSSDAERCARK
eukprot:9490915-Pyramimonas_sp.AAC.1